MFLLHQDVVEIEGDRMERMITNELKNEFKNNKVEMEVLTGTVTGEETFSF